MKNRMMANLLIACMIAGITIYASNAYREEQELLEASSTTQISAIDPNSIDHIQILSKGHDKIELRKIEKDRWVLTKPVNSKADLTPIDRVMDILTAESHSKYDVDDVSSLESLGLRPAKRVVRLNEHRFVVGGFDPLSNRLYVLYDDKVHLIDDTFSHFLLLGYPVYANRLILPDSSFIEAIQTPSFRITKGDDAWQTDPQMSPKKVQAIFRSWKNAFSEKVSYLLVDDLKDQETTPVQIITSTPKALLNLEAVVKEDEIWLCRKDIGIKYHLPLKLKQELLPEFN